jgi:DNA-binding transcriptional ArsR family regulator/uncharacterized protein YndB with AHSA1/START domain
MQVFTCMTGVVPADVFRALADGTRRELLDRLRHRNGQTLTELVAGLATTRQTVTQHLQVLEQADLVVVHRRGRERLHYLNPVPIHDIQARWIDRFDAPRLDDVARLREKAQTMTTPDFVYVTYIHASAERVWDALTSAELTARFWGHSNVSDWGVDSPWQHVRTDGSGIADVTGRVVRSERPHALALSFGEDPGASVVTFAIEPFRQIVRLTITHTDLPSDEDREIAAVGWASVAANLKTLLETGDVLPQAPWEMHVGMRAQQTAADDAP